MSAVIRSTTHNEPNPYVHKLRLEARDGAVVEIRPTGSLAQAGARIAVRLIGFALAMAALMALLRNQFS
jgi:hypothetical protein